MRSPEEVSDDVTAIVARVLQISPAEASGVRHGEHEAWNSLKHIEIVLQVEEEFEVQFEEDDIAALSDVNSIVATIGRVGGR